jgi:hypothetical protein
LGRSAVSRKTGEYTNPIKPIPSHQGGLKNEKDDKRDQEGPEALDRPHVLPRVHGEVRNQAKADYDTTFDISCAEGPCPFRVGAFIMILVLPRREKSSFF